MNTLFNFGCPSKDYSRLAEELLGDYKIVRIPVTDITTYLGKNMQIVSPCYGTELTWDTLSMMKDIDLIDKKDNIIFLGSMGSLDSNKIKMYDIVIPVTAIADYLEPVFKVKEIKPNKHLLSRLEDILDRKGVKYVKYNHGPDLGVCDPRLNHINYKHATFGKWITGVDCGETFVGMCFCERNNIKAVTLFYCSDDPSARIKEIPKREFERKAKENDALINRIGHELLTSLF